MIVKETESEDDDYLDDELDGISEAEESNESQAYYFNHETPKANRRKVSTHLPVQLHTANKIKSQQHIKPKYREPVAKPIAWAYNTENNHPDFAITKLSDTSHQKHAACCSNNLIPPGPAKLSLQEAFEMNRYDVISRSRQRQKEIQYRTEQRQQEAEYEIERMANLQKNFEISNQQHINQRYNFLNRRPTSSKASTVGRPHSGVDTLANTLSSRNTYFEVPVDTYQQKRSMTQQEIKSQTRKNYRKLPEVKQKQMKVRAEEIKRRNRVKSDIYKKVSVSKLLF